MSGETSVSKYMVKRRKPPSQTWRNASRYGTDSVASFSPDPISEKDDRCEAKCTESSAVLRSRSSLYEFAAELHCFASMVCVNGQLLPHFPQILNIRRCKLFS